jgi:hypothetical protein
VPSPGVVYVGPAFSTDGRHLIFLGKYLRKIGEKLASGDRIGPEELI